MYSNSLAKYFSSMFHDKCLLPRLDRSMKLTKIIVYLAFMQEGKNPKIRPVICHSIHCAPPTPLPQHGIAALLLLWKLFVRLCMDSGEGRVARTFARYVVPSYCYVVTYKFSVSTPTYLFLYGDPHLIRYISPVHVLLSRFYPDFILILS